MGVENRANTGGTSYQLSGTQVESPSVGSRETALFVGTQNRKRLAAEMRKVRGLVEWAEQTRSIGRITPKQWRTINARYFSQDGLPLSFSMLEMMWGGRITRQALSERNKRGIEKLEEVKRSEAKRPSQAFGSKKEVRRKLVRDARDLGHLEQLTPREQGILNARYPVEGGHRTFKQCVEEGLCRNISSGSIMEKRAIINLFGLKSGRPIDRKSRLLDMLQSLLQERVNLPIEEITARLGICETTAYKYMRELDNVPKRNGRIARQPINARTLYIMNQVKSLLEEDPNRPVKELAHELGFKANRVYDCMRKLPDIPRRNRGIVFRRTNGDRALTA